MTRNNSIGPSTFVTMCTYIYSDLRRYRATGISSSLKVVLTVQGFWATSVFRISTYLHSISRSSRILRNVAAIVNIFMLKVIQILTGISIPVGSKIGPGLYIGHFGSIVVAGEAVIGENCNIGSQVVIGFGRSHGRFGVPVIGNRVFIGPGAKVLGPVKIGDDVAIGANAVVTHDLPDRAVAVGVPANIVSYKGSFDYIHYDRMEEDDERKMSLYHKQSMYSERHED